MSYLIPHLCRTILGVAVLSCVLIAQPNGQAIGQNVHANANVPPGVLGEAGEEPPPQVKGVVQGLATAFAATGGDKWTRKDTTIGLNKYGRQMFVFKNPYAKYVRMEYKPNDSTKHVYMLHVDGAAILPEGWQKNVEN